MTGEADLDPDGLLSGLKSAWLWRGVLGADLCFPAVALGTTRPELAGEDVTPP